MSNEGGGGKQTFHSIESMKDLVMQWKGTSTIILVDQRIGSCSTKKYVISQPSSKHQNMFHKIQ
jgi:hypothetical protein